LSENERVRPRFRKFYVALREQHDDFADQIDDVGIGATRHLARELGRFSGRHFVLQDLST
jgi:hypothetical protein